MSIYHNYNITAIRLNSLCLIRYMVKMKTKIVATPNAQVNFKEFMKRDPDYIRIYKDRDADKWVLYGSADIEIKVYDKLERQTVIFEAEREDIKIDVSYMRAWDDKTEYINPTQLNFHSSDCETLKTLLAHKPTELYIKYWHNNMSESGKRDGHKCETVIIEGRRFNKNGKLIKVHRITIHTPSYFGSIASRYRGY